MLYDAYGDESAAEHFVAYGTILIPTDRREAVETEIARLKASYGVAATDNFHCRVLFSGQQRKKSVWSKLTLDDVFVLYSTLIRIVKPSVARTIVALARKKDLPDEIPGGQWEPADPNFAGPMNWSSGWPFRDKQIASLCAQGTMIPISKWPGLKAVTFWPDPDSTIIEIHGGRRRFSQTLSGFIDNGDGNEPPRINVSFSQSKKPVLLQVADLVAYVAQRAASAKYSPLDRKFEALNIAIGAEQLRLGLTPQGGIGFNIPNELLARR